jgi:two-component system chemotaxis sensor kinase CheA/two-component system sensor histidine kinase and response regulator WspE
VRQLTELSNKSSIFSGIVLNENYEMVSALHIPTIIKMARRIKTIDLKKRDIEFQSLLKSILVIVISSLASEEDQDHARKLGASRYIVKNSFDNHNLLEAVKELAGAVHE